MFSKIPFISIAVFFATSLFAQKSRQSKTFPDSIAPVGIIKGLSDSALLDVVQRQLSDFSGTMRIL